MKLYALYQSLFRKLTIEAIKKRMMWHSNFKPTTSLIDSKCALYYATCFSRGLFCGCSHLLSDSPKYWGRSRDITTIYEAPPVPVTHLAVKNNNKKGFRAEFLGNRAEFDFLSGLLPSFTHICIFARISVFGYY